MLPTKLCIKKMCLSQTCTHQKQTGTEIVTLKVWKRANKIKCLIKMHLHRMVLFQRIINIWWLDTWTWPSGLPWMHVYQVDCLALICVNHAFLRMVRKYELITHFPVVYADLRAVCKFAMILVWCPACTPVRLHHSPWTGVSLGFLVRKKHVIIVQVLISYCQQIGVIKCRYLVNHTGITCIFEEMSLPSCFMCCVP